ncbi:MAG: hypothetical protein M3070_02100, partial [Actinomycetota bacterium]|nr:hypothetical protein [Actinomycetota bacterium]
MKLPLAMIGLVVCPPTDITGDHVTDLRHSNLATGCGFMQCGHFVAVVLLPVGVLVLEDDVAVQRMDVVLIEGPESLDCHLDETVEICKSKRANDHGCLLFKGTIGDKHNQLRSPDSATPAAFVVPPSKLQASSRQLRIG